MWRTLARWSPIALLLGLLGLAIPYVVVEDDSTRSATAQVELTDNVEWPFFGAVRQRIVAATDIVESDSFFGDRTVEYEIAVPVDETWIDVTVTADSGEAAIESADLLADRLVEIVNVASTADASTELQQIDEQIAEFELEREALAAQIAEELLREAELERLYRVSQDAGEPDAQLLADYRGSQDVISAVRRERDAVIDRQTSVLRDRDEVRRSASGEQSLVRVLRSAALDPADASPRLLVSLLGAVVGLFLGMIVARLLHAEFSTLATAKDIRSVTNSDVVSITAEEFPLRMLADAKNGAISLSGDAELVGSLLSTMQAFGDGDSVKSWSRPAAGTELADRDDIDTLVADIEAASNDGVVLLDAGPAGSAWAQLMLSLSAESYFVARPGQYRPATLQSQWEALNARTRVDANVLLISSDQ